MLTQTIGGVCSLQAIATHTDANRHAQMNRYPGPTLSWAKRWQFTILVFAIVLTLFAGATVKEISGTAAFYAHLARDIADAGDPTLPYRGDHPYLLKPPITLWMAAAAIKLLGPTSLAASFFSRLFGVFAVLLTYAIARRWYGSTTAWFAALVLVTLSTFHQTTATFRMDSCLTAGVLLAFLGYLHSIFWWGGAAYFGGVALGVLAKGVPGLAPLLLAPLHIMLSGRTPTIHPYFARWGILLLPLVVWYGYLWQLHGARIATELVTDAARGPSESFWQHVRSAAATYIVRPLGRHWPWVPFTLAGFWFAIREVTARELARPKRARAALLLIWIGVTIGLAAIKPEQDIRYLYIALPPAAILTGRTLARTFRGRVPHWLASGLLVLTGTALLLVSGLGWFTRDTRPAVAAMVERTRARPAPTAPIAVIGAVDEYNYRANRQSIEADWAAYYLGLPVRLLHWKKVTAADIAAEPFVLLAPFPSRDAVMARLDLRETLKAKQFIFAVPPASPN
jgi:4-amino-4-deoxy-L-arabinose transferase-like glycosyltransferase